MLLMTRRSPTLKILTNGPPDVSIVSYDLACSWIRVMYDLTAASGSHPAYCMHISKQFSSLNVSLVGGSPRTSGELILTDRMLASTMSWRSQRFSERSD